VIVVDANVVIAASTPGHIHHDAAQQIVADHGGEGMVLHSLTMAEVLVGPGRSGAEKAAHRLLTDAGFRLAPQGDPAPEHLARVRASTTLKMPDACVLATAENLQVALATFNRRVAREAGARGITVLGEDQLPR